MITFIFFLLHRLSNWRAPSRDPPLTHNKHNVLVRELHESVLITITPPLCVCVWHHAVDSATSAAGASAAADSAVCVLKGIALWGFQFFRLLPSIIFFLLLQCYPAAAARSYYHWRAERRHQSPARDAQSAPRCGSGKGWGDKQNTFHYHQLRTIITQFALKHLSVVR